MAVRAAADEIRATLSHLDLLINNAGVMDVLIPPGGLATAIDATAHGHAMLLLHGDFGRGEQAVEPAAEHAALATRALVESRHLLGGQST
jgi:NAD(P)-dependent dehydrogenase (short-subunit alcohol dehydrogenase family)